VDAHTAPREGGLDEHSGTFGVSLDNVANLPVRAVMTTPVLVTTSEDDLALAWELMIQAGIRHLPVVDGTRLIGMIDDRRLVAAGTGSPFAIGPRRVHELVEHPPLQVHTDTTLREAATLMAADRADTVCVTTQTGDLIGIVTRSDLVRALAGMHPVRRKDEAPAVTPLLFRLTPVLPAAD
jgi:CBS domain-containing protein